MESTNKVKLFKHPRQRRIHSVLRILILICVLTVFYFYETRLAPDAVPVHPPKKHYYDNDAGQTDKSDAAPLLERIGLENPYIYDYIRILRKDVEPENLINLKPYKFLPNYRNPCWDEAERLSSNRKKHTPYIRCMPYYYLIGAPKCGTTDLFTRLIRHPEICGNVEKEPHWLTRKRFLQWKGEQAQPRLNYYYEQFNNATRRIMAHNNKRDFHSHIVGDHSAATIFDNGYWSLLPEYNHLEEPLYTNSDYIHHINPQAKIIAMVRNPIDRLYSDYLYFNRNRARRKLGKLNLRARHGDNQVGPHEFHELAVREIHTFNTCLDKSPLRYCLYTTYLTKNIPKHVVSRFLKISNLRFGGQQLGATMTYLEKVHNHAADQMRLGCGLAYTITIYKSGIECFQKSK